MNNQKFQTKKQYKKPNVSIYGDINVITKDTIPGGISDGGDWGS